MKYIQELCPILRRQELTPGVFEFVLDAPQTARLSCPGQFVDILVPGRTLRRPISLCGIDREQGTLRIVFEVRGEGTEILSRKNVGDTIDIIGPLGHGFTISDPSQKAVFVGGGIGVPPLLEAAKAYGENASVFLGFRNAGAVILEQDFQELGCRVTVATDDGSAGYHGLVTHPLKEYAEQNHIDVIYACGPRPMLRAAAALAEELGIRCEVSLEERMGCGVGACLVCVCKTKTKDGGSHHARVCCDGPVFDAREVSWE
ncbi:MAG: dihydroorotate dehydrogenase electron transfer subunit [Clostridiales bacterium]|nr:dihydroorotate dehydrogenase electron transfer subunit [Clostridiales bacterium]